MFSEIFGLIIFIFLSIKNIIILNQAGKNMAAINWFCWFLVVRSFLNIFPVTHQNKEL